MSALELGGKQEQLDMADQMREWRRRKRCELVSIISSVLPDGETSVAVDLLEAIELSAIAEGLAIALTR